MIQDHEAELAELEFAVADARFKTAIATAVLGVVAIVLTLARAKGLYQRIPMSITTACWGWFASRQWVKMWQRYKARKRIDDAHRARWAKRAADRQRAKENGTL